MHAANRLIAEDKQLACIMGCAMGGQVNSFFVRLVSVSLNLLFSKIGHGDDS